MDLQLKGKLALVTGSTAGIGYAIAETLAREGAQVIVNGRTEAGVDAALAKLRAAVPNAEFVGFPGDLGIFEPMPFESIPDSDWHRLFEVNVVSGVRLARLCLPWMKRRNWGRIIFISSESAVQIPAEMIHYGVTKTAQLAVSRGLAEALAGTGITVNCVLPGPTMSRGVGDFVSTLAKSSGQTASEFEKVFFEKMRPTSLIKRFITPQEVAALVAYVASPLASATTGAALRVDGGVIKSAF